MDITNAPLSRITRFVDISPTLTKKPEPLPEAPVDQFSSELKNLGEAARSFVDWLSLKEPSGGRELLEKQELAATPTSTLKKIADASTPWVLPLALAGVIGSIGTGAISPNC